MAEEKNKVKPESVENNTENTVSKDHSEERNITENTLELILGEKGYEYYLNNKKQVTLYAIIIGSLILAALAYKLIYVKMIVEPKEEEAIEKLWQAWNIKANFICIIAI